MTYAQRDFLRKQIDTQVRERLERARSARAEASARAQARTHEASSVTLPVETDSRGTHSRVQDQTKYYAFNLFDLTFDA